MDRLKVLGQKKEFIYPAVANYFKDPLVVDHAEMQHIWDSEGKKYLDFFGGIVTVGVGHCNPRVTGPMKAQIDKLQHASTMFPNAPMMDLAEKIAQISPGSLQKSFFSNSGTEANETAIESARLHTGNLDIIALRHGYHGRSNLTRALTGISSWRRGTFETGIVRALNPYCYRCPFDLEYPSCGVKCAHDVENVIQSSTPGKIAAFIAEPIQGVGGFITPPKEYFKIVFNIVKQYGGDFISDEVQTGWGRTGKKWFGIEHWEVEPDILVAAKSPGNGHPIGLTVATPEIADAYTPPTICTYGGNPVTSVAARAVIAVIEEDELLENCHVVGGYFQEKLKELQKKYALIGDVRGMGMMQAMELVMDRKTKQPATQAADDMLGTARDLGLLIGKGGMFNNTLRMSPPMNVGKSDVDEAVKLLDQAFATVSKKHGIN